MSPFKSMPEEFRFRNSPEWLQYSHQSYIPLDEIRHRLNIHGQKWEQIQKQYELTRKAQSIPFPFPSINKVFWFFEADIIRRKIAEVEQKGISLYDKIHSSRTFEPDFILNVAVEEAVTSAIYEGANSTRAKAKQLIAENRPPADKDEQMLVNNFNAIKWIKSHSSKELTKDLILTLHELVTRNTMEGDLVNYVGKFRDDVIYIGPHEGIEHSKIESAIDEAISVTTKHGRYLSPLLRGILLHYFIAYIHPFFDGNGRTARTLFYYKALKYELKFVELLSISAHLKAHGKRYERAFENAVKYDGDVTYFVDFSLDSLLLALKRVQEKVEFLINIGKLKNVHNLGNQQIALLQRLALNKFRKISIGEFAKDIDRTHEMARLELKALAQHNLLIEERDKNKSLYRINSDVLKQNVAKIIAAL
ncbi:MAG: Fic family protein [Deltaproteobacteria bacterium]|nr:Fic family protein [Deltaproteobacteria bacterium]